jgi:sporulation protein YlmC with PRC-barrel domain
MTRRAFASLALSAVIVVSAAWAQEPNRPGQSNQPQMGQSQQQAGQEQMGQKGQQQAGGTAALVSPSSWYKAKDLIGKNIKDKTGADVGNIDDLIMLPADGFIPFAIMSGSKIGKHGEDIALPWSALQFEPGAKDITLAVSKDELSNATLATFKTGQWPDFALPTFVERVYHEFGQAPPSYERTQLAGHEETIGGAAPGTHWFKISTLRDEEVKDSTGAKIGTVDNVVIDLHNGHILFVTLAGSDVGRHNEMLAVPWGALRLMGSDGKTHLVLDMTKDDLKKAPAFKSGDWAGVTSPSFLQGVFAFYHVKPYWEKGKTQEAGYVEPKQPEQQQPGGEKNP